MPITLSGSGTVTGISAGGLPDGIIQSADLASGVGGKVLQVQYAQKTDTASNNLASQTWWSIYNTNRFFCNSSYTGRWYSNYC